MVLLKFTMINKKAQIWVETVIYTLIGLALIGLVLAIATPRINEFRDKAIIEQTIDALNIFDSKINEILSAPGNIRIIEFNMRRGDLYFNTTENKILYVMEDSRVIFSEPDVEISLGRINVTTTEGTKRHTVSLLLDYSYNLTFNGIDGETVKFSGVSVPYRFSVENKGFQEVGKINIDIREIS